MTLTPRERIDRFVDRMMEAPAASSQAEAFELIAVVLNAVEDEHSGAPFNPNSAVSRVSDGRMYPPQPDSIVLVADRPGVVRARHRRHVTYVRDNGAIQILLNGKVVLDKPGNDGRCVF
jgi:hypothetical protein